MNRETAIFAIAALALAGCNSSGSGGALDPNTKVLASNVVYVPPPSSTVSATNVQAAIQQLSLDLATTMVGTWTIANRAEDPSQEPTGRVTIGAGGTFDLETGSFSAIGMGSGAPGVACQHQASPQTWELVAPQVAVFTHVNPGLQADGSDPTPVTNAVFPMVLSLEQDRIVFLGSGGCGNLGTQRLSVLTRVTGP